MNRHSKIGFIGLGLIGGSIAKAIRQYHPNIEIVAFDKSKEALALAKQESIAHITTASIDEHFCGCDYIFLCAPVAFNNIYLEQLRPFLHPNLIITDVGSVKTPIHEEVHSLDLDRYFIGGHPMTGSEKSGYANAKAVLLENAYYIVTPSGTVSKEKQSRYIAFLTSLKALPVVLDYEEHDYIAGAISHLPHVIAATLVNFVKDHDTPNATMKQLAAGGFKDITRIASSSPMMWQQICFTNKERLSTILEEYIYTLQEAKKSLDAYDTESIYELFDRSRSYRNSISNHTAGSIEKVYAVYCDIIDEAGGIATIATILASNQINMKNIGIIHNREFEEGVLRIEFYDEPSSLQATQLLTKHRYVVYKR